jgi:hypothetical protein
VNEDLLDYHTPANTVAREHPRGWGMVSLWIAMLFAPGLAAGLFLSLWGKDLNVPTQVTYLVFGWALVSVPACLAGVLSGCLELIHLTGSYRRALTGILINGVPLSCAAALIVIHW